jgi:predicted DNA-binding protein YlxM (UPF0122 family)
VWEHAFVTGRPRNYDWDEIRRFYEDGRTVRECQERFGFSNGAWHEAIKRGDIVTNLPSKPRGQTRDAVSKLVADGLSLAEIARVLDVSKPTVCFHMRMLGIPPHADFAQRYDWGEIRAYYDAGHSMTECKRRFGFSANAWWDAIRRGAITPRPRLEPLERVLIAGRRRSRYHLKARLLTAGLKQPRVRARRPTPA